MEKINYTNVRTIWSKDSYGNEMPMAYVNELNNSGKLYIIRVQHYTNGTKKSDIVPYNERNTTFKHIKGLCCDWYQTFLVQYNGDNYHHIVPTKYWATNSVSNGTL